MRKPALIDRTRLECAGTVLTAQLALEHGLACNLAGGTHHAHRSFGSGFTILNDLAVAAARIRATTEVRRVAIVDLDVHQGDGTAAIFADEPDVFTMSMHCGKNFPFRKQVSDLDVDVEVGTGDIDYLRLLRGALEQVFAFKPDLGGVRTYLVGPSWLS
uniref:Histone deacetylase domain-containing protein n=2 Tax=Chrysotila carterae TaxID=13221 RepID=A0A7S4F1X1_CHRCT